MAGAGQDVPPANRVPTSLRSFFFEDPHFKDSWDNYDVLRDMMTKESDSLWKKFDEDMKQLRCLSDQPAGIVSAKPMFPRKWMVPHIAPDVQGKMQLFGAGGDHDLIRFKEDEKQMEVSLDTAHYKPEELHVKVVDGELCIEGKHEEKSEDGKHVVTRRFQRKYTLPKGTRADDVSSNLSSDGVLVVKALKADPSAEVEIKMVK